MRRSWSQSSWVCDKFSGAFILIGPFFVFVATTKKRDQLKSNVKFFSPHKNTGPLVRVIITSQKIVSLKIAHFSMKCRTRNTHTHQKNCLTFLLWFCPLYRAQVVSFFVTFVSSRCHRSASHCSLFMPKNTSFLYFASLTRASVCLCRLRCYSIDSGFEWHVNHVRSEIGEKIAFGGVSFLFFHFCAISSISHQSANRVNNFKRK